MTPSDLYAAGINAPEPLMEVYSIERFKARGSKLTRVTDLYPKSDNANELAGVCNQVVQGFGATWAKHIDVQVQDGATHAAWDDADGDQKDDNTRFVGCKADV